MHSVKVKGRYVTNLDFTSSKRMICNCPVSGEEAEVIVGIFTASLSSKTCGCISAAKLKFLTFNLLNLSKDGTLFILIVVAKID